MTQAKTFTTIDLHKLLEKVIPHLTPKQRAQFAHLRIPTKPVAADSGPGTDGKSIWIVARSKESVLYFDGNEQQFGLGRLDGEVLTDRKAIGPELGAVLDKLPH